MTGNLLLDLLISFGGVAVLVLVSFLLGGWKSVRVDEAAARDRLAFDEPDFRPAAWLFDRNGAGAAALSEDGKEAAFVFALGDGLATRRLPAAATHARADGARLFIGLRDPSRWTLAFDAGDPEVAARWASRLAGRPYNPAHGNVVS